MPSKKKKSTEFYESLSAAGAMPKALPAMSEKKIELIKRGVVAAALVLVGSLVAWRLVQMTSTSSSTTGAAIPISGQVGESPNALIVSGNQQNVQNTQPSLSVQPADSNSYQITQSSSDFQPAAQDYQLQGTAGTASIQ